MTPLHRDGTSNLWVSWLAGMVACAIASEAAWTRHTVDASLQGADGVRLGDANRDGLPDITTAWEESGIIRVYLNPGLSQITQHWPMITVGKVSSPEDAVFVDLDHDGMIDVISSCEGNNRSVYVHWAPAYKEQYENGSHWRTEPFPALHSKSMWMFCTPGDFNQDGRTDLMIGSKGAQGTIGWLEAPDQPRNLESWIWHPIQSAGWIMSIQVADYDKDGDLDAIISDRKGPQSGIYLLENRISQRPSGNDGWESSLIGASGEEVMFIDARMLEDKEPIIIAAQRPNRVMRLSSTHWLSKFESHPLTLLSGPWGSVKAVAMGDINLDGRVDTVITCENADGNRSGVLWIAGQTGENKLYPLLRDISGEAGVKFDRMELLDLDGDSDLDILTCEERDLLGVIWYENPTL